MIERPGVSLNTVGDVLRSAGLLRDARGAGDLVVSGACQDSRDAQPGDLFLAWRGMSADAHDFIPDAVARGAKAAVVERFVDADVPQLLVSDGRGAAALAAHAVMGSPADDLWVVGVTGTNGKTTTTLLARHLLEARAPAASMGTLGVVDGSGTWEGTEGLTTPGPVHLAERLRALVDRGVRSVVMEASSHALAQHRLDAVPFAVAVFTNLTRDHLDYHADLGDYLAAKARLVDLVADDGTVVINRDAAAWDALDARGRSVVTFAVHADARVRAEQVVLGSASSRFTLVVDDDRADVELPLLGGFNVENALAAASVAAVAGMNVSEIADGLRSAPQVRGRLEAVLTRPYAVLIDFAHTPDALEGVLRAVKPVTHGRLIVVFGAGGDRDPGKRRPMGETVRRHADVIVLTSDNPRTEDPEKILDDLAEGLVGVEYVRIADRKEAVRHALSVAQPGDTVLLAGKGHETYQDIGGKKRPFDERVVVRECLSELGAA